MISRQKCIGFFSRREMHVVRRGQLQIVRTIVLTVFLSLPAGTGFSIAGEGPWTEPAPASEPAPTANLSGRNCGLARLVPRPVLRPVPWVEPVLIAQLAQAGPVPWRIVPGQGLPLTHLSPASLSPDGTCPLPGPPRGYIESFMMTGRDPRHARAEYSRDGPLNDFFFGTDKPEHHRQTSYGLRWEFRHAERGVTTAQPWCEFDFQDQRALALFVSRRTNPRQHLPPGGPGQPA
jgi:hypothetical protein